MHIGSEIVGSKLKEFRAIVTWRHTTNYAAAVEDLNSMYLDDEREGGIIAPPTFATALTWPIIANINDYIELGYSKEVFYTMVHYYEHIELHRPLVPGDRLSIKGEVAAVLPHPKGTQIVFKFLAVDMMGKSVFTEFIGGMLRGVTCHGEGRGADNLPFLYLEAEQSTEPIWECPVFISRAAPYIYDRCADVTFAIHTSPAFARSVGLPDIIYHGVATLAQALRELINREVNANPALVNKVSCFFKAMVLTETNIRIQLLRRSQHNGHTCLDFRVLNQEGGEAVSNGRLEYKAE